MKQLILVVILYISVSTSDYYDQVQAQTTTVYDGELVYVQSPPV